MIKRNMKLATYAVIAAGAIYIGSNEANAKGCNGVVDQLKWGCAAWDNNNGPQYPHYKAPQNAAQPAQPAAAVAAQPQKPNVVPNGGRIISNDGASAISHDGSSLVGNSGGTARHK